MDNIALKIKQNLDSISLLVLAGVLRFVHLGYSDYQGDEIKALFLPDSGQSISDFLLTQRKGPVQFLITYILKIFDPTYSNEFFVRLPFAIAGTLAVYFFYKFLCMHFNKKAAYYSTFFIIVNGFFIAFSRIVQYQSFVILFMVLALYFFSLAAVQKKWSIKGIYLGFIMWGLSILSHYDGVFIFPFVLFLLLLWLKNQLLDFRALIKRKSLLNIKHAFGAGIVFFVLLALFYIPFIFNIDAGTQSYWQGRLVGTGGKISNSRYLFSVYQPIYVIHIYTLLFIFGVIKIAYKNLGLLPVSKLFNTKIKYLLLPFLVRDFFKFAALFLWFFIPFIFLEVIVSIPGTHIYTYLLPLSIILAFGILFIEEILTAFSVRFFNNKAIAQYIAYFGILIVFLFMYAQAFFIFVDHVEEYPWSNKEFLIWVLPRPSQIYHLSIFGFPYNRGWEEISSFITTENTEFPCQLNNPCEIPDVSKIEFYSTNERDSISRHYIPYKRDIDDAGYYIFIHDPQSFSARITQEKAEYWLNRYNPVKVIYRTCAGIGKNSKCDASNRVPAANIYYMPQGSLSEIKALGY